jgi:hypothetical protein
MLDPTKIPLAKVKDAFRLKEHEAEGLVTALWPQHVFPWELWRRAFDQFWRGVAADNEGRFKLKIPPYPEMTGIWADAPASAWSDKMYGFFTELAFALPARSVQSGLDYIIEETYEDSSLVFPAERESLFANLTEAEDGFEWHRFQHTDWEKLNVMLDKKAFGRPSNCYRFLPKILTDSMVVDKFSAVRYLLLCGYPFAHEVKGLSRDFIERVKATLTAETPINIFATALQQEPVNNANLTSIPPSQNFVSVPRSLWAGKTKEGIREAMRKANFGNEVIAHVLLHKRGLKLTQREIGELLSPPHKSESTHDKNGKDFVEQAALITVIDAPEP